MVNGAGKVTDYPSTLKEFNNLCVAMSGVNILQKEEDFVLGIFGVLLGRIPGF